MFVGGFGANFNDFGALETGLKFDGFPWPPRCAPELRDERKWTRIIFLLAPTT